MMMNHDLCLELLEELECQLKATGLWSQQTPPSEALMSSAPFCIDTLRLEQWLQFVFLPRMRQLMEQKGYLSMAPKIVPVAELALDVTDAEVKKIIATLKRIEAISAKLVSTA
jgi:uncharacterized protein YqcC (DUF446 family)